MYSIISCLLKKKKKNTFQCLQLTFLQQSPKLDAVMWKNRRYYYDNKSNSVSSFVFIEQSISIFNRDDVATGLILSTLLVVVSYATTILPTHKISYTATAAVSKASNWRESQRARWYSYFTPIEAWLSRRYRDHRYACRVSVLYNHPYILPWHTVRVSRTNDTVYIKFYI